MSQLSREEVAKIEVGHTTISSAGKYFLFALLLCVIVGIPAAQIVYDMYRHQPLSLFAFDIARICRDDRPSAPFTRATLAVNKDVLHSITTYEDGIQSESLLRDYLLPYTQYILARCFRYGNEKASIGKGQWLFYQLGVAYVAEPGFLHPAQLVKRAAKSVQSNPIIAITNFAAQLRSRGIQLVLLPIPDKISVYPEKFANVPATSMPNNVSYRLFLHEMQKHGVEVLDMIECFSLWKTQGVSLYLETDTHWTPDAMTRTAEQVATHLRTKLTLPTAKQFSRVSQRVCNQGDVITMLDLPRKTNWYTNETVEVQEVRDGIYNVISDPRSEVLILGDSFCNIYSLCAMNWGESAGLVEHVSYYLGQPVDAICRNDAGAFATRKILSDTLKRGTDRLANKRIVLWEFAMRELAVGDWQSTEMTVGTATPRTFLSPQTLGTIMASGEIIEKATVPRPGSVPYADHIIAIHLGNIASSNPTCTNGQALVYMYSMTNNIWTTVARYRVGDRINLKLEDWSIVENSLGGINRSELSDELTLEYPWWGTEVK